MTPPRRHPNTSAPQSRVRFSRVLARSPLHRNTSIGHTTEAEPGSPSKRREGSPLTLPYAEFEPATDHESDITEEAMEMDDWGKEKQDSMDRKEAFTGTGESDNTSRRRVTRNGT